jgi:hypothetical protein
MFEGRRFVLLIALLACALLCAFPLSAGGGGASTSAPPFRALAASALCSHQGRLHPGHRPVLRADLLQSLQHLLGLSVRCFDLDLSPLPGGGSAVAHPAALAARPAVLGGSGATATAGDVFDALGAATGTPAVLTLELKGALGADGALLRALGAAAARAGMQGRVALLGVPAGARLPAGLLRAHAIRDVEGCTVDAAALSRDVAVACPSAACWRDAAVRARVGAWAPAAAAAAAAAGGARALQGVVALWPVDDAGAAGELAALGEASGLPTPSLLFVTNAPRAMLGLG